MVADSLIDHYLSDLAEALPGPPRWRQSVLDEARDNLLEAMESHLRAAVGPAEAARLVIDEFGPVPVVAAAFAPEIAMLRARFAGLVVFVAVPLLSVLWYIAAHHQPDVNRHGQNALVRIAAVVLGVNVMLAIAGSLGSIFCATRRVAASRADHDILRFTIGVSGAATTMAVMTLLGVVSARAIVAPGSISIPATIGALMATLLTLALVVGVGVRCLGVIQASRVVTLSL